MVTTSLLAKWKCTVKSLFCKEEMLITAGSFKYPVLHQKA